MEGQVRRTCGEAVDSGSGGKGVEGLALRRTACDAYRGKVSRGQNGDDSDGVTR